MRNMMLLFNKNTIDDIEEKDITEYVYAPVDKKDEWKIQILKELIDVKNGELQLENICPEEVENLIEALCTE